MWEEFAKIGKLAWEQGLFSSHGGNMSVRVGEKIYITRRGSMLGCISEEDVIETVIDGVDSNISLASTEIVVHREIYKRTSALAIFHAHPPLATALSMICDEIILEDSEGSYILKKVPVVSASKTVGSKEVANIIPEYLKEFKVVMLKGHGSFSTGMMLEEAFSYTSTLEHSCKIMFYKLSIGKKNMKKCEW
ncbi:MAG: aldolase [Proteobacteria bacterium]|nr:aldolase [Pseudomonadota bacterium]